MKSSAFPWNFRIVPGRRFKGCRKFFEIRRAFYGLDIEHPVFSATCEDGLFHPAPALLKRLPVFADSL
jgi:hypothetical protein